MVDLHYDRKDYYSILSFLKDKALELSNGRWSDFSDADIGTVLLKLMAYLSDMNNYHLDRGINELYIDTAVDRASLLSLCKLLGYKPNHYLAAHTVLTLHGASSEGIENDKKVEELSTFTNAENNITYTNIDEGVFQNNICKLVVYQGVPIELNLTKRNINELGQIYLDEYQIGTNTIKVKLDGKELTMVDDVRFSEGESCFSVHMSDDKYLYIQLPSSWSDNVTDHSSIVVRCLRTDGINGRIGENVLTRVKQLNGLIGTSVVINSNEVSQGGFDPESIEDIKINAPEYVRTMDTIVTLEDFKSLVKSVPGVSDVVALDYNNPDSGLIQPDDAYKVLVYVLPEESDSILIPENQWTPEQRNLLINYGIQPLTELGEKVREYIDQRRLSSLDINYVNVEVLRSNIVLDVYMDSNNLKFSTIAADIKDYIVEKYKRGNTKIGQNLYASQMGANVLKNFPEIEYLEVRSPVEKIVANSKQFINVTSDNISINMNAI